MSQGNWLDRPSYTLPEVSDLTGIPLRSLVDGCRAKRIPHSRQGRTRVMTPDQIRELLESTQIETAKAPGSDDLEAYRTKVKARLARKRGAA